jgi:hypothetical protein
VLLPSRSHNAASSKIRINNEKNKIMRVLSPAVIIIDSLRYRRLESTPKTIKVNIDKTVATFLIGVLFIEIG